MHLYHNTKTPALLLALLALLGLTAPSRADEPRIALQSQATVIPALRSARSLGRLAGTATLHLGLTLPLRNQGQLTDLLRRLYAPDDPMHGKFLTPAQFTEKFGPTPQDYEAVAAYAKSQGLTVTAQYSGRTLLDVAGPASRVETAFGVRMGRYQLSDGREVYANAGTPSLPRSLAVRVAGVAGLTNIPQMRPYFRVLSPRDADPRLPVFGGSSGIGTGPAGGLAPSDIKYAYSLSDITPLYTATGSTGTGTATLLDGTGQTIGLFELDGYNPADIVKYITQFNLPTTTSLTAPLLPTVTNILLDNFSGGVLTALGQGEVTLDIDMVLALAPNATGVYVYESADTVTNPLAPLHLFMRMAGDLGADGKPLLKVISNSWGLPETQEDPAIRDSENTIFQQMAAQGQSFFTASGDLGAFDAFDPAFPQITTQPAVDNPASQPFVTAVGGTTLSYNKPTAATTTLAAKPGSYVGEIVWKSGGQGTPTGPVGSGGGSSVIWAKPGYQQGLGASPFERDVPDVALNADENTGYDIYVNGAVATTGGSSAAAPLWAGFAALVNEQRATNSLGTLGFANPPLYAIGNSPSYTSDFHDITTGDNLYYPALPGYDDATGFGSFIGDKLLAALSFNADQGTGTGTLTGIVSDPSGAGIASATITVSSSSSGATKVTGTSDGGGNYTLTVPAGLSLTVSVGTSTVTPGVDANGNPTHFAGQSVSGITVAANGTASQNFTLSQANTFTAGLQMISAPFDFSTVGDFAAVFGLTTPLQSPNPRLIQWQPQTGSYVFYPTAPADTLRPGQGYWIKFVAPTYVHRQGAMVPTTQSFRVTLQQGWNQIGDPFLSAAPLSGLTVDTTSGGSLAPLSTSPLVQPTLYEYTTATGRYDSPATDATFTALAPYRGYWIFAKQTAVLIIPAQAPPPPPSGGGGIPTAPPF